MPTSIGSVSAATRVLVGGNESLVALRTIARAAGDQLLLDAFKLNDPELVSALSAAASRTRVEVLADDGYRKLQSRSALESAGVRFTEYGSRPFMNHGKSIVGERGAISTSAFVEESSGRFDFTALLDEADSSALRNLMRASIDGDVGAVRRAAGVAAEHGIVVNDPRAGVTFLTEAVDDLLGSARRRLVLASKELDDPASLARIASRAHHDVPTTVALRNLAKSSSRDLGRAGAKVHRLDIANGSLHGNAIVSDDAAYVGTAYLRPYPLNRERSGVARREIGFVSRDRAAVDVIVRAIGDRIALG